MPKKYVYYMKDGTILENLARTWKTETMNASGNSSNATDTIANGVRTIQGTHNNNNYGGMYYRSAVVTGTNAWVGPADTNKWFIVTCEMMDMTAKATAYVGWYSGGTMTSINGVLRNTTKKNEWQRVGVLCKIPTSLDSRCYNLTGSDTFKYAFRDLAIFEVTNIDSSLYPAIANMEAYAFKNRFSSIFVKEGDGIYRTGSYVGIDAATEDETAGGTPYKAITPDKLKAWINDSESYKVKDNSGNEVHLVNLVRDYLNTDITPSAQSSNAQSMPFDLMRSIWGTINGNIGTGGMYFDATAVVKNQWIGGNPNGHKYIVMAEIMNETSKSGAYVSLSSTMSNNGAGVTVTGTPRNAYDFMKWTHVAFLIEATNVFSIYIQVRGVTTGDQFRVSFKNLKMYDVTNIPESYYPMIAADQKPLLQGVDPVQIQGKNIFYKRASIADVIGNTTNKNYIVDGGTLHDAVNLGRAVDLTTGPLGYGGWAQISFDGGSSWTNLSKAYLTSLEGDSRWRGMFSVRTNSVSSSAQYWLGFSVYGGMTDLFPKRANTLKYLVILDVRNAGAAVSDSKLYTYNKDGTINYSYWSNEASQEEYTRAWGVFAGETGRFFTSCLPSANTNVQLDIKTWRQYEVTMLSDEAIVTLANMPIEQLDDAFYRYLVKQDAVNPWIDIIDMSNAASVTIGSGLVYKLLATAGSHVLTVDTFPEDAQGEDAYISITTSSSGVITVQAPLVLMDPLRANAINNCRVLFRNGEARLYVDDVSNGYIVVNASGTESGSLFYGLTRTMPAEQEVEYISFSNTLDGETIEVSGVAGSLSKPVSLLGNGKDVTTITFLGGMVGTNQAFTVSDATVKDLILTSGNLVLEKCIVEGIINASGSTVSLNTVEVNGNIIGNVNIPNDVIISGSGTGVIDIQDRQLGTKSNLTITGVGLKSYKNNNTTLCVRCGGTTKTIGNIDMRPEGKLEMNGSTVSVTAATLSGANGQGAAAFAANGGTVILINCLVTGNSGPYDIIFARDSNAKVIVSNCIVTGNSTTSGDAPGICAHVNASAEVYGSTISNNVAKTYGAGLHAASASIVSAIDCLVTGNTANTYGGGLAMNWAGGSMYIDRCTITNNVASSGGPGMYVNGANCSGEIKDSYFGEGQTLLLNNQANITLSGTNTFDAPITGNAIITIVSGATINLAENGQTDAIVAGKIVIQGGLSTKPTMIIYDSNIPGIFEDVEIHGRTITNTGLIYGATVYSHAGDDHYVYYIDDNHHAQSIIVTGETTYVVPGGLRQITGT